MPGARRRWGWHELEGRWAERLVVGAEVRSGELVIDVGAGTGAITAALVAAGARVLAIELHPGRAAYLRRRFEGRSVVVIEVDAGDLRLPRRPFRVVANPPYAITGLLMRRLLSSGSRLQSAHIICQQQVAHRWVDPAAPGAGRWAKDFAIALGPALPRHAFRPPPKVNSRLVVIERKTPAAPGKSARVKRARSGRGPGRDRPGPR